MQASEPDEKGHNADDEQFGQGNRAAIDCSAAIFLAEREHRIGHSDELVFLTKVFLFTGAEDAYVLLDHPFVGATIDETDAQTLFVRIAVRAINPHAVLFVAEGWYATRCDACGAETGTSDFCGSCNKTACAPSQNKFRKEILTAVLEERDTKRSFSWKAGIVRNQFGTIVAFDDYEHTVATPTGPGLRFERWWQLHTWMVVHCYRNLQLVTKAFECELRPEHEDLAQLARSLRIPGEVYLRVDQGRLERCVRKVNVAGVTHAAGEHDHDEET